MELFLNDKLGKITLEIDQSDTSDSIIILAHGAGAGMNHHFMQSLAAEILKNGVDVARFNFPYMEKGRRAPGSPKDAIETWRLVLEAIKSKKPNHKIYLAGKSYGGRMASHLLASHENTGVSGIIYFGFPLHAPGKDSKDRAAHLNAIASPQLFIQGTKDKLANMEMMLEVVNKLPHAEMIRIESGDHSFKVPKSTGISPEKMISQLASVATDWIRTK